MSDKPDVIERADEALLAIGLGNPGFAAVHNLIAHAKEQRQRIAELARERDDMIGERDMLLDEKAELYRENERLAAQCAALREGLSNVWSAIGDALCSGNGIDKTYANAVSSEITTALRDTESAALAYCARVRAEALEEALAAMLDLVAPVWREEAAKRVIALAEKERS